jgi:hypothetical protein
VVEYRARQKVEHFATDEDSEHDFLSGNCGPIFFGNGVARFFREWGDPIFFGNGVAGVPDGTFRKSGFFEPGCLESLCERRGPAPQKGGCQNDTSQHDVRGGTVVRNSILSRNATSTLRNVYYPL